MGNSYPVPSSVATRREIDAMICEILDLPQSVRDGLAELTELSTAPRHAILNEQRSRSASQGWTCWLERTR